MSCAPPTDDVCLSSLSSSCRTSSTESETSSAGRGARGAGEHRRPILTVLAGGSRTSLTVVPAKLHPPFYLYKCDANPLLSSGITMQGEYELNRFVQPNRPEHADPNAALTPLERMMLTVQHISDIDELLATCKKHGWPSQPCTRASNEQVGLMRTMCT